MACIDELNIDELQDTIVDAIANIVHEKIAQWLWDEVGSAIDNIIHPSMRSCIWQQIAQYMDELANNIRTYAQQLAQQ